MPWSSDEDHQNVREVKRLLRIVERALEQLEDVKADLNAPGATELVRAVRSRTGSALPDRMGEAVGAVEEAIRALKVAESQARADFLSEPKDFTVDGLPNLPTPLARFLAERADSPGFSYELEQDAVRGWIIRWKEHAGDGLVRGSGQFYERPYAWLDE